MIDLHCHSYFSDGVLSPESLLAHAKNATLKILALTDHDTVEGVMPLHTAAHGHDITIINGIELSTRWKKHDIHILGLNFDLDNDDLHDLISRQKESRYKRAESISERLKQYGVEDALSKAQVIAGHDSIGRPHFAQVLVNEGIVMDIQSAFTRFLRRGRGAYVPTPWISVEQAVAGVNHAGGDAIIAHPLKYALTRTKLHELIRDFKSAGGAGLEVVSGMMMTTQIKEMASLCARYELFASSGSDYHGGPASKISLGQQQALPLDCKPIWQHWNL